MENKFKALRFIAIIYKILGIVILVIGIALSIALPLSAPQPWGSRIGAFLALLFATLFYALFIFAAGEFISLGLAIEENTRYTKEILSRKKEATSGID